MFYNTKEKAYGDTDLKLLFLGTKGEIEESTERHRYNSSLLLASGKTSILIDYGVLHRYSLEELKPDAILITHAHPDHYAWLYQDIKTEVPVYLTRESLDYGKYKPQNTEVIVLGEELRIGSCIWSCYRVIHSIRCPAVGFKVKAEGQTLVYNSDLIDIIDKDEVLKGVDCYIGDGSAIKANLVRRRGDKLFGHTRITTQLNWCQKFGIKNAIFTHLGRETLGKEDALKAEHPEAIVAYDGMELTL